jgi:hypothetical protein
MASDRVENAQALVFVEAPVFAIRAEHEVAEELRGGVTIQVRPEGTEVKRFVLVERRADRREDA